MVMRVSESDGRFEKELDEGRRVDDELEIRHRKWGLAEVPRYYPEAIVDVLRMLGMAQCVEHCSSQECLDCNHQLGQ